MSQSATGIVTRPPAEVETGEPSIKRGPAEWSPYLAARCAWDEADASAIPRARNWRLTALLALAVALVAICGVLALAMRAKVILYVVAIDNLGRVLAAGPAEQASRADDRLKRAALFQ